MNSDYPKFLRTLNEKAKNGEKNPFVKYVDCNEEILIDEGIEFRVKLWNLPTPFKKYEPKKETFDEAPVVK